MSSTKKPEPYAPDMFSEHARLAQLGAKFLEIQAAPVSERDLVYYGGPTAAKYANTYNAARSLGLLEEKGGES